MQEMNTEEDTSNIVNIDYDYYGSMSELKGISERFISKAVMNPPEWWKKLTAFKNGSRTIEELLEPYDPSILQEISEGSRCTTSKRCPGIVNHLRQSLVIKTPHDIIVKTGTKPGQATVASQLNLITSIVHDPQQTGDADFHTIMLRVPIRFKSDKLTAATVIDPVFYNDLGYRVSPGVSLMRPDLVFHMNVICLFPREEKTYHIKKDSVIALLQFSNVLGNLNEKDLSQDELKTTLETQSTLASTGLFYT